MHVRNLIDELKRLDGDLLVAIAYGGNCLEPQLEINNDVKAVLISPGQNSIATQRFGPGRDDEKDVHTEHCCHFCGCKYSYGDDCTVESGKLKQSFPHLDTSVCYDQKPGYRDNY